MELVYSPPVKFSVELHGVSKRFRNVSVLNRADLEVPAGSICVLMGPNGAGKTTLLKILATVLFPDEGSVCVQGYRLPDQATQIRANLSFAMGEDRGFYWRLTARQNLEFFAVLYGLTGRQRDARLEDLALQFELGPILHRPVQELSTGTRQRLSLARACLNDAPLLLADEPTRSLDSVFKTRLKSFFQEASRKRNKTILLTTHDLQEAQDLGDQIILVQQGRLQRVGKAVSVE